MGWFEKPKNEKNEETKNLIDKLTNFIENKFDIINALNKSVNDRDKKSFVEKYKILLNDIENNNELLDAILNYLIKKNYMKNSTINKTSFVDKSKNLLNAIVDHDLLLDAILNYSNNNWTFKIEKEALIKTLGYDTGRKKLLSKMLASKNSRKLTKPQKPKVQKPKVQKPKVQKPKVYRGKHGGLYVIKYKKDKVTGHKVSYKSYLK